MKHTQEEILKALRVIKDECNENNKCQDSCPFSTGAMRCLIIAMTPNKWKINDDPVTHWKGLL